MDSSDKYQKMHDYIKNMAQEDLKIDSSKLSTESANIPTIYHKYLQIFNRMSYELKKAERELDQIWGQKYKYFMMEHQIELKRNEIESFIKADDEYLDTKTKVDGYRVIVEYLEQVLKQINQKSFNIRNAIEWERFKNGLN